MSFEKLPSLQDQSLSKTAKKTGMREKRLHEENLEQNIVSLENYLEGLKELEEVRLKKLRVLASLRK